MEQEIIERWERGKENLRKYFEVTPQSEYDEYPKIVSALIHHCLNYGDLRDDEKFSEEFEVSDHGDYQGTQIFLLHMDCYQPDAQHYYVFDNYYGSCSCCDTLLGISGYESGIPTKEQVDEYMTLCLHMVQRMKWLGDLLKG
jgi:hypothetical protein|nr:MAG TPA: hypothetical protein [Caudoviricetes sp.]